MNNVAKYLCIVREKKERKQTIEKNKRKSNMKYSNMKSQFIADIKFILIFVQKNIFIQF